MSGVSAAGVKNPGVLADFAEVLAFRVAAFEI